MLSPTFCLAPFVQITAHPSGSFSPCPYLGGTAWQSTDSLSVKWNDPSLESLRNEFLEGKKPDLCHRCWNEEDHGKKSLRQRFIEYDVFQDSRFLDTCIQDIRSGRYRNGPKIVSIKNGNLCNAKCRSCHPEDSTPWILDSIKIHQHLGQLHYKINVEYQDWNDQQIEHLVDLGSNLRRLELFGGEPLFNKKVIGLLSKLIEMGHASHIDLYINTNGSINIPLRVPDIYQFASVDIGVSIDALPQHFGYVRHPLDINNIEYNIESCKTYFVSHKTRFRIQPITTVSTMNVWYLPQLKSYLEEKFDEPPFWNLLIEPQHLNISNLPESIKTRVIQHLEDEPVFAQFVNVLQENDDRMSWNKFCRITQSLDLIRGENFADVMPEWAEILGIHDNHDPLVVFVGDLSQPYQGQYLISHARNHDCHAAMIKQNGSDIVSSDTVIGDVSHLPGGTYYTGITHWQDINILKRLLDRADDIYYVPPPFWSDGPEVFTTLCPPRGWSQILLEDLLENRKNIHIISAN